MKKKAFTLIEILTVVIIISILATLAVPPFVKTIEVSKGRLAKANLKLIYAAEKVYRNEHDSYYPNPAGTADLAAINADLGLDLSISGPFDYSVTTASDKEFTATATRNSGRHSGLWILSITQDPEERITEEGHP